MLKKNHRSDDTFSIETRAASLLSSLYIVYLYGPGIPYLYVYSFFEFLLVYFADRYLLIYYFKIIPNHGNTLMRYYTLLLVFLPLTSLIAMI